MEYADIWGVLGAFFELVYSTNNSHQQEYKQFCFCSRCQANVFFDLCPPPPHHLALLLLGVSDQYNMCNPTEEEASCSQVQVHARLLGNIGISITLVM